MKFLHKIGFLKTTDDSVIQQKPVAKSDTSKDAPGNKVFDPPKDVYSPVVLNNDFSNLIEEAFKSRDLPGPDFLEFYKSLEIVKSQPISEQQKYVFAFSGLQVMGLTKEKIVESSKHYLNEINNERERFMKAIAMFSKTEISDKQEEIKRLSERNLELQKEIEKNMSTLSRLGQEVHENTNSASMKTNQFDASAKSSEAYIVQIIDNVNKYL